jgi:hypothetical protein
LGREAPEGSTAEIRGNLEQDFVGIEGKQVRTFEFLTTP